MFKLAAMTFAMRDAAIDKLNRVINYHKDLLNIGDKILPSIEEAALKGDDAAKLFLRQTDPLKINKYGYNEEIITKNFRTIKNLEANRNSKGDFLGIGDPIYDILKNTTGANKPKVIRGDEFYKNLANEHITANNMPATATEKWTALIKDKEIKTARERGWHAEGEADDIVLPAFLHREQVRQKEYADSVFEEAAARQRRSAYLTAGLAGGLGTLGLVAYMRNKEDNTKVAQFTPAVRDKTFVEERQKSFNEKSGYDVTKPETYERDKINPYLFQHFTKNVWNKGLNKADLPYNNYFSNILTKGTNPKDSAKITEEGQFATKKTFYNLWNNTGRWNYSPEKDYLSAAVEGRKGTSATYDHNKNTVHAANTKEVISEAAHGYQSKQSANPPTVLDRLDHGVRTLVNNATGKAVFNNYSAVDKTGKPTTIESKAHNSIEPNLINMFYEDYSKNIQKVKKGF